MPLAHHTTGHKKKRKHRLIVRRLIAEKHHNGRIYRLLDVTTQDGLPYRCLRLHNSNNHFIKQFLFEPTLTNWLIQSLNEAVNCNKEKT